MTIVDSFFDGKFVPQGESFQWQGDLLFLHVLGDLTIALAFIVIPFVLFRLAKIRRDLRVNSLLLLFAASLLLCSITHIIGVLNIWYGYYYLEDVVKAVTGLVCIATAIVLWRHLASLATLPSAMDMEAKMAELQQAQDALIESNRSLEAKVAERTEELERIAYRDSLTNLLNRREITRILDIEIERAQRQKTQLSLLMLDLDHFKSINDKHGHRAGDSVLKSCAASLEDCSRRTDFIGRIGGEEFVILLPNTGYATAIKLAERCRQSIEKSSTNAIQYTCSIGVAALETGEQLENLMQRADEALYSAKESGRNNVK